MGVEVATAGCLQWSSSNPIIPHSHPPCSPRKRCRSDVLPSILSTRHAEMPAHLWGSAFRTTTNLIRTRSFEVPRRGPTLKRSCSASFDAFHDEEFSKKISELSLRFSLADDALSLKDEDEEEKGVLYEDQPSSVPPSDEMWKRVEVEPPEWHGRAWSDVAIERKANDVGLPLSLRMIKRKIQWREGFREAGESAYCSVTKAFSSLVFIIRELHSYSLYMREALSTTGDIQTILERVQREIHASFVWLFQRVFAHTPTLMVSVMILLANFTVHSMAANVALANPISPTVEASRILAFSSETESSVKATFPTPSPPASGMSTFVGGGGGGKFRPVSSGTDGEGGRFSFYEVTTVIPDGGSSNVASVSEEDEVALWESIVEETREMQAQQMIGSLDPEIMNRLVAPVTAAIEPEDPSDYYGTAMTYQIELQQDPNNPLLLANYAQFLYLVSQDYDRAEDLFRRAVGVEPKDAEACNKYACFLWKARNDLWAAEETFLEAIAADPSNSFYAANYANFLWNTGGEDTCFPLPPSDGQTEL